MLIQEAHRSRGVSVRMDTLWESHPMLDFVENITDSVWGDIPITKAEQELIHTNAFMRLRHIKQMSLAFLGHHGAHHTRFEHSIGCAHVAFQLVYNMTCTPDTYTHLRELRADNRDEDLLTHIRIAALLHDIGHAPMSHLVESVFKKYPYLLKGTYYR